MTHVDSYQAICRAMNAGWWKIACTTGRIFVDEYLVSLFGFPSVEMDRDEFLARLSPEQQLRTAKAFDEYPVSRRFHETLTLFGDGIPQVAEFALIRPETGDDGTVLGGSGFIRLKKAAAATSRPVSDPALQEPNDLLAHIINYTPMYLFVKDTGDNLKYLYSSPMMDQLYGPYDGSVVGKTDFDLFEDPAVAEAFREKDREIIRTGRMQRFVERMTDPEGVERAIDTRKLLVPRAGKPPYLLGMAWDITLQENLKNQLEEENIRLSLACKSASIYPWTWYVPLQRAEFILVEKNRVVHYPVTHPGFVATIHPDEQELYEAELGAFARGEKQTVRVSFRSDCFSDDYVGTK